MAGPQQGQQLLAGRGTAVAVEGQAFQCLVPRGLGGGLDAHLLRGVGFGFRFAVAESLDDDGHLAELEQVADAQRPLAGAQTHAVEARAVGAAQVAQTPAAIGEADLGVIAADRVVVEHDFQRIEPADAQQLRGFPRLALERAVHATQANGPLHTAPPSLLHCPYFE